MCLAAPIVRESPLVCRKEFFIVSARLNLASQPFRNRALPWTISAIVTVASLIALVFIISAGFQANRKADLVERQSGSLRQQLETIRVQAEQINSELTPTEKQTLNAAQALIDRKRFSWSRLFADLESALPSSIRVTRITVRDVYAKGGRTSADLDLTIVSKSDADVTGMIAEMGRSGIFQADVTSQNLKRGRGEGGTEWTLFVHYSPRTGVPTTASKDNSIAAADMALMAHGGER